MRVHTNVAVFFKACLLDAEELGIPSGRFDVIQHAHDNVHKCKHNWKNNMHHHDHYQVDPHFEYIGQSTARNDTHDSRRKRHDDRLCNVEEQHGRFVEHCVDDVEHNIELESLKHGRDSSEFLDGF